MTLLRVIGLKMTSVPVAAVASYFFGGIKRDKAESTGSAFCSATYQPTNSEDDWNKLMKIPDV